MENLDSIYDSDDIEFEDNSQWTPVSQEDESVKDIFNPKDDDFIPTANEGSSVLNKFLQSKGFVDSKIKVIDENEKEIEVKFSDLSEEEQLDLLNSFTEPTGGVAANVGQNEQAFLNELKNNNLSIDQFLELYKESVISEAGIQPQSSYDIDQYDDKELFLLDLKNKFDDLTDEELQSELDKELQNEDIFNKKISKIRSEYKELEDQYKANQQAEFEAQQQQQYNEFVDQMSTIASNVSDFHGLELEDEEKNETLSYLLELDENGMSQFYKDLNNPDKLYEVAWYLKYGKDAFRTIEDVYEKELSKLRAEKDKPRVVRQQNNENTFNSLIDDIFE